jgi:hypothetical protein
VAGTVWGHLTLLIYIHAFLISKKPLCVSYCLLLPLIKKSNVINKEKGHKEKY